MMNKTKPINKQNNKGGHRKKANEKRITNQEGDPLIKNLNDFVTSIKIAKSSKPLYTGGRILAAGKHLYSSCNQEISIYSFEQAQIIDKIKHVNEEIVNFCVCPFEKYIVTFTQNSMARVMHLQSKKIIQTIKLNGFAQDMQFSADGKYLALALANAVHIFTFEGMKRTHTYNPTNSKFIVTKIQWHPNPQKLQIFSCDMQRNIAVFDYILNKVVSTSISNDGGKEFCLALNGEILVAINNLELKIYDARNLQLQHTIQLEQYIDTLYSIDNQLYLGGQETELLTMNLQKNYKLKSHPGCTDNGISKIMSFGKSNSRKLLVLSTQQNISVLKICNNHHFQFQGMIVGYNDQIIDIKYSKLAKIECPYFIIVTNSNNVKVMNIKNHRLEFLIKGHTNTVIAADYWHPFVATAGKDNMVKLWKINDELKKIDLLANYSGHSADVLSLVALPQSKMIATVSEDLTIKLWPMCLDSQQKLQIKSAIRTTIAHQKSINAVRVSPKEDMLVTVSQDRTIKIWNQNLINLMTLTGHRRGVWDAAFHPVQHMLVSAGGDGMLKGWDLQSGECLWSMGEGAALIRCSWIYYNQIVTGSLDGIVKIWDFRKQTSLSYDKHEGKIWALDVNKNADGQVQLMSGATDSVYHVWCDNTEQMKSNIMLEHELEEQQKIFYEQNMHNKKYCDAAVIAFKSNYTKLFMNVLQKMNQTIDPDSPIEQDTEGKLHLSMVDENNVVSNQQFEQMVNKLKDIDLSKLLLSIQTMASTVKLYKVANRILVSILKTTNFTQLSELNSKFVLQNQKEDINTFNQKKSGLMKWLQYMINFEQKHSSRLQKYVIGTHWIQHLHKIDNPFSV